MNIPLVLILHHFYDSSKWVWKNFLFVRQLDEHKSHDDNDDDDSNDDWFLIKIWDSKDLFSLFIWQKNLSGPPVLISLVNYSSWESFFGGRLGCKTYQNPQNVKINWDKTTYQVGSSGQARYIIWGYNFLLTTFKISLSAGHLNLAKVALHLSTFLVWVNWLRCKIRIMITSCFNFIAERK